MINEQGSEEWLLERVGHITSSRIKDVMDRTKKGEPTAKCESYKNELIYGILTGNYIELGNFWQLRHGKELEPEARSNYAFKMGLATELCGFEKVDADRLIDLDITLPMGGSPDLIIPWSVGGKSTDSKSQEKGGAEIKCPQWENHIKWLGLDTVPGEHYAQCQANMWICGAMWWDFVSYNPTFPVELQLIVRRTYPDDAFLQRMFEACQLISKEVHRGVELIRKTNPMIFDQHKTVTETEK